MSKREILSGVFVNTDIFLIFVAKNIFDYEKDNRSSLRNHHRCVVSDLCTAR